MLTSFPHTVLNGFLARRPGGGVTELRTHEQGLVAAYETNPTRERRGTRGVGDYE